MKSLDLLFERFAQKVLITESCWLWQASRFENGYGYFQNKKAHRVAYELFKGLIPDGLQIDHLCRVRHCVNPNHLEAVTSQKNILRCAKHEAHVPCPHGSRIKRCCDICDALYMRNWLAKRKKSAA